MELYIEAVGVPEEVGKDKMIISSFEVKSMPKLPHLSGKEVMRWPKRVSNPQDKKAAMSYIASNHMTIQAHLKI